MTLANARTALLIRNPTAGRRRRGLVDEVVRLVEAAGWTVDLVDTEAAGDAWRLARECDEARYSVLAVAGGDGTINEAVNGLAARTGACPVLAVIPLGTANVLAHELGLGRSPAAIAQAMIGGHAADLRPGAAFCGEQSRCFSLMAGAGFDANVVAGVTAPLKRRFGRGAYVWRSLVEAQRYRPVRYEVEIDGARYEAASVIVTRSRHYAGPYIVAPAATLAEPVLHVCLFERWGRVHTLRFGIALLGGWLPRADGYRVISGREVRVSVLGDGAGRQPVQIDGDDALSLPVSIGLAPTTIRVLCP